MDLKFNGNLKKNYNFNARHLILNLRTTNINKNCR